MAKFRLSVPFTALSGKVGGIVASTRTGRGLSREMVIPRNPNTEFQRLVRDIFSSLNKTYSALTRANVESWLTVGREIRRIDPLSQTYGLFGNNAYVSVNFFRLLRGLSVVSTAPPLTTPPAVIGQNFPESFTAAQDPIDDSVIGLNIALPSSDNVNTGAVAVVSMAPPYSSQAQTPVANNFRLLTLTPPASFLLQNGIGTFTTGTILLDNIRFNIGFDPQESFRPRVAFAVRCLSATGYPGPQVIGPASSLQLTP